MSFTADIGTEPPKGSFRLWAAKPPLVGESCASWVQRLCGDHQYSFKVLGQVLGDKDRVKAGRVMQAMMQMKKIIIADLEKAAEG